MAYIQEAGKKKWCRESHGAWISSSVDNAEPSQTSVIVGTRKCGPKFLNLPSFRRQNRSTFYMRCCYLKRLALFSSSPSPSSSSTSLFFSSVDSIGPMRLQLVCWPTEPTGSNRSLSARLSPPPANTCVSVLSPSLTWTFKLGVAVTHKGQWWTELTSRLLLGSGEKDPVSDSGTGITLI